MKVEFTIPGEPQGKGRPRFAKVGNYVRTYTPDNTVAYENLVKLEYQRQCGRYMFSADEMLDMRIFAYYGIPKSVSRKRAALMLNGTIRPSKKPDADNVIKVVADACNGIAYRDDAQIVDTMVRKFYSDTPHVKVVIKKASSKKSKMEQYMQEQYKDIVALYGIDLLREIVKVYDNEGN